MGSSRVQSCCRANCKVDLSMRRPGFDCEGLCHAPTCGTPHTSQFGDSLELFQNSLKDLLEKRSLVSLQSSLICWQSRPLNILREGIVARVRPRSEWERAAWRDFQLFVEVVLCLKHEGRQSFALSRTATPLGSKRTGWKRGVSCPNCSGNASLGPPSCFSLPCRVCMDVA